MLKTCFMKYGIYVLCSNYMNFLGKSMNKIISLHEQLENSSGNTGHTRQPLQLQQRQWTSSQLDYFMLPTEGLRAPGPTTGPLPQWQCYDSIEQNPNVVKVITYTHTDLTYCEMRGGNGRIHSGLR